MLRITACLASLAGALFLAAPAAAAPRADDGTAKSSSISLVIPATSTFAAAVAAPSHGDLVTFAVSTNETAYPFVNLKCYQGRELVAEGWDGFFDGALGDGCSGCTRPCGPAAPPTAPRGSTRT